MAVFPPLRALPLNATTFIGPRGSETPILAHRRPDQVFLQPVAGDTDVVRVDFDPAYRRHMAARSENRSRTSPAGIGPLTGPPARTSGFELQTAGEQEVQDPAGHPEPGLFGGPLAGTQAEPFDQDPVGEAPQGRALQVDIFSNALIYSSALACHQYHHYGARLQCEPPQFDRHKQSAAVQPVVGACQRKFCHGHRARHYPSARKFVALHRPESDLHRTASGSPAPTYQWKLNNTNLVGQTNAQLSLSNNQTNQTGTYSVSASNLRADQRLLRVDRDAQTKLGYHRSHVERSKSVNGSTLATSDWWELSNFGNFAVNLQGWRFDDSHDLFSDADTVTNNVSIAPGESIVLVEAMTAMIFALVGGVKTFPPNLQIITYPSIGFSSSGDAIYLWNAAATAVTDTVASVISPPPRAAFRLASIPWPILLAR